MKQPDSSQNSEGQQMLEFIQTMKHSPVHNYVIPGLTSWLIGAPSPKGTMRLFECSRDHPETITPHSHRFSLHYRVLAGTVTNMLWTLDDDKGDEYRYSDMGYDKMGHYTRIDWKEGYWSRSAQHYQAGDEYSMGPDQVHSIYFSKGAVVLLFEGPTVSETSLVLEPIVDGKVVPTFKVEPWMFQKG